MVNIFVLFTCTIIHNFPYFTTLQCGLISLFQEPYIVQAKFFYLNTLSVSYLPLFASTIHLFASYIGIVVNLVLFGLIICIFYHFERKLSAILDFTLICWPYWIYCHSPHFWNARPHLGEPILLSFRSICQFRGHF